MSARTPPPGHLDGSERRDRELERLAPLLLPLLTRYFGAKVSGTGHVPDGPALLVGNHSGGMSTPDTFLLCTTLLAERGPDHLPFGLAHDGVIRWPGVGALVRAMGGVRGCHEAAAALFEQGRKVLVYPGGDHEAYRPTSERHRIDFAGRVGYARLAIRHQVPIVPVVSVGSHGGFLVIGDLSMVASRLGLMRGLNLHRWPVTASIPWGLLPAPCPPYLPLPTRILVDVLPPMEPPKTDAGCEAYDRAIRARMQDRMNELVNARRAMGRWAWSRGVERRHDAAGVP